MVYAIELQAVGARSMRVKTMARGATRLGLATRVALAGRVAVEEKMRTAAAEARKEGVPEVERVQLALRKEAAAAEEEAVATVAQVEQERRASARNIYNDWNRRGSEADGYRTHGHDMAMTDVDPRSLFGHGIMHEKAGLWKLVVGSSRSMVELWQRCKAAARRQMRRAGWRACKAARDCAKAVVQAARERPDEDLQRRFERTYGAIKVQQPLLHGDRRLAADGRHGVHARGR